MALSTARLLEDRLAVLISESENPTAEMQMVSKMLLDADLMNWLPSKGTSPQQFAATVFEDSDLRSELATGRVYLTDPDAYETAEQLINSLLPASSE